MGPLGLRAPLSLVVLLLVSLGGARSEEFRAGSLIVKDPWSRPTPPSIAVGVVYLSITNSGNGADKLLSIESPRAQHVEMHESRMLKGVMEMRPIDSLECPAGATVRSEPGGVHIMLLGLDAPLVAGSEFPLTLKFRDAGHVTVKVRVEARVS